MTLINQYSFVVFAIFLGLVMAGVLWRWESLPLSPALRVVTLVVYAAAAVLAWTALRYPEPERALTLESVEDTIGNGRPTFVMLYSNY